MERKLVAFTLLDASSLFGGWSAAFLGCAAGRNASAAMGAACHVLHSNTDPQQSGFYPQSRRIVAE